MILQAGVRHTGFLHFPDYYEPGEIHSATDVVIAMVCPALAGDGTVHERP